MTAHSSLAAQYVRMSTEVQRYSLENQKDAIAAYASKHGLEIVATYADAGMSGVTANNREGLKHLLRDVLAPNRAFDTVLVLDVSRWGRFQDPDEAAHYEFICAAAGVQVRYCAEAFESDGSLASTVMKQIKRVMAGEYSRELSVKVRAGVRKQTVAGNVQGGPPPYGARRQVFSADGTAGGFLTLGERRPRLDQVVRWVPGPTAELSNLREIFRLYGSGKHTISETAEHLNASGSTYRGCEPWNYARVKGALTNEIAIGAFVFNRRSGNFGLSAEHEKPPSEWRRVRLFGPIVKPALFEKVRSILANPTSHLRSDENMLECLRKILSEHGRLSVPLIDACPDAPTGRSYFDRFGTLSAAYRLIGYVGPKASNPRNLDGARLSNDDITASLKSLLAQHGYLSGCLIQVTPGLPSRSAVARRFGSLNAAWASAGFHADRSKTTRSARARG